jgi:hypothetical protein
MSWHVHYQRGDERFSAATVDRTAAIAVACILLRDGHDVVRLESPSSGETIEAGEIRRLCDR